LSQNLAVAVRVCDIIKFNKYLKQNLSRKRKCYANGGAAIEKAYKGIAGEIQDRFYAPTVVNSLFLIKSPAGQEDQRLLVYVER
jgi:hypothetical protein